VNGECAFKTAFFNKFVFWNVLDISRSEDASATITKRGRFGYLHEARTLRLLSRSEDASATTGIGIAKRQLRGIA
jgi:hypothetical protein